MCTLEEWSDLPDGDRSSSMKLTEHEFHEEQRHSAEQQREEIRHEERTWTPDNIIQYRSDHQSKKTCRVLSSDVVKTQAPKTKTKNSKFESGDVSRPRLKS